MLTENLDNKSSNYWLLPLQAAPAVLLLFLLYPLQFLETYGKSTAALQLLISCSTIPLIQSLKHNSFRVWACSSLIVPLPILIFNQRLFVEPLILAEYYLFLVLFFLFNYQLRKLTIFIPLLIVSFFGSIFIWGIGEMFSSVDNDFYFYMSPILNFFLNLKDKMTVPIFFLAIISILGYAFLLFNKYILKVNV